MQLHSYSVADTLKLGKLIARHLNPQDILCLKGELGVGKTILTKGIAQGVGIDKAKVTSASFIIMRKHTGGRIPLYHFDLYRLKSPSDISSLGYEEYFYGEGVSVIEWAERLDCLMPAEYLMVELSYGSKNQRIISFSAFGKRYKELLKQIYEDSGH